MILSPDSQASTAWTNIIPNALADYYTFRPFDTIDANALGFPAGVCGPGPTQQDCYTITVKDVQQQLALPTIFGGGQGLLNRVGVPFATNGVGTLTSGYGSGGLGWTPPGAVVSVRGNAPAVGPFSGGVWHFPGPTIKATSNRPIRIQWLNELSGALPPPGLDPSLDCGATAPYCYPYNRIVTHVHGAHVGPESDGFANAWFSPVFTTKGQDFIDTSLPPYGYGPPSTDFYPNSQEAGTIWYHDHAMGTTHENVNMGLAGFFPITDNNEKCLQGVIAAGTGSCPPGQAKVLPYDAASTYELGFALQDRIFYTDGQNALPDLPTYYLNTGLPGGPPAIAFDPLTGAPIPCSLLANGLPDPSTCKRLDWMYSADGTHLIPYDPANIAALSIAKNANAPFGAPSTTLEYFGNMPMVNGVTFGKYDVQSTVYRIRLLNGTDSRSWILSLNTLATNLGTNIPFYQIASEGGKLNAPILRTSMLLMPGERLDVLVDFTGIAPGTRIYLNNLGPDTPYQGEANPVRSVDIPVVMVFDVGAAPPSPSVAVPPSLIPATGAPLRPIHGAIAPLVQTPGTTVRKISLMEITDQYARTLPTIDGRGFMPMGVPITETMLLNDIETWDIINTTMDAHPMHLHLVQFQVIGRIPFDNVSLPPAPTAFVPPVTDPMNGIYREPSYTATGAMVPPDPWDAGWKDTVYTPPGFVTRVRAKFDILGTYVWHCHILSHEEHDMMRPQVVVNPITAVTLTPGVASPRPTTGGQIPFTASGVVGGTGSTTVSTAPAPEYRFSYKLSSAVTWTLGRDYTTQATWNWTVAGLPAGSYDVKVDVRNVGVVRDLEASATVTPYVLTTPVTSVTLTATPPSPTTAGTGISFTAAASGGSGTPQYQFYFRNPSTGVWTLGQAYSAIASWAWNTTGLPVGNYTIQVWARNAGSTATYEAVRSISYTLSSPVGSVTLVSSAPSPQSVGNSITFTALATGGSSTPRYQFFIRNPSTGTWSITQAYSTTRGT